MPRKNKKTKITSETKSSSKSPGESDEGSEKPEKKGLLLSLDKKLKMQIKKQKKKEKKKEFEAGNKRIPEEVSMVPEIEWESVDGLEDVVEATGTFVEDVVEITQPEVVEPNTSPEMTEEEEKSLREFLRTLDIVDKSAGKQHQEVVSKNVYIETIPEDLFEEFIENEEMVQSKEAIRAFPRTSPKHSPNLRRKEPIIMEPKSVVVNPPPKVFYNYYGVSFTEPYEKSFREQDFEEGVYVIHPFTNADLYPRRLDVILEESSDFSDTSGHSDKRNKQEGGKGCNLLPLQTVKMLSANQKDGAVGDCYSVQPVIVEKLKMSDEVVKIELAETDESEGDFEITQSETSNSMSVNLGEERSDGAKSEEKKREESVKSISSSSTRVPEEGSESWRSSLNDGADADVESELDSQRAIFFWDADDDLSIRMSDLVENNDNGVEIFITDYKKIGADSTPGNRPRDSWNSLNGFSLYEVDGEGLFQKKFLSNLKKKEPVELFEDDEKREEVQTNVNVKQIAEKIKDDMDRILMSKMKVMRTCEDAPRLSETSWVGILKDTKPQSERKGLGGSGSSETNLISTEISGSSSYENVQKSKKVIRVVRKPVEAPQNPEALSNLAEKKVLTLPYGRLVLKKIGLGGCCSKDSDSGKDIEEEAYIKTQKETSPEMSSMSSDVFFRGSSMKSSADEDDGRGSYIEFDYSNPRFGETEKWYGMRTKVPAVLVGLSPSQKKAYEERQKKCLPDEAEAASLLDLHRKFLERRSYNEGNLWTRERNLIFDSNAIAITDISRNVVNQNTADKVKEKKIAKENMQSPNKVERLPGNRMTRLVGNEKSENEDGLLKSKCYSEKEKMKEEKEGETNSEEVGNSRLLAILQNAISDESVPELNTDSSIKSSGESHEVSVVRNQETMMDNWQKERRVGSVSKKKVEGERREESSGKTFQDIWSKERKYCSTQDGIIRGMNYRPKTICCENESELYVNEPKFVKEVRTPKNAARDKQGQEEEELVVTENLPAVSDVIRSFETPRIKTPVREVGGETHKRTQIQMNNERYQISKKGDIALIQNDPTERRRRVQKEKRKSMPASILSEKEIFKQKMYDEYMSKLAERIERRQQKVIKVSQSNEIDSPEDVKYFDIVNEFINKVKERKRRESLEMESLERKCQEFSNYWEGEITSLENGGTESMSSKRSSVQLLLDNTSDVDSLPKHLKELLQVEGEEELPESFEGVWSPAQRASEEKTEIKEENEERKKLEDEPIPPVWTPRSAQASPILERKEFRPVNFESPTLPRKKYIQDDKKESSVPPPWQQPGGDKPPELAKSSSSPALSLPKAPNPTVTLLQKAREGHLPRGAHYLNSDMKDSPASDGSTIERLEIVSSVKSESDRPRKIETGPKKVIGIGPTTKEGIPLVLRSEVSGEENRERWYKRMYDSLHKYGKDDDFVTVKYRTSPRRQGLYNYQHGSSSGYQSEPESLTYDLSTNKYVTLDRRRNEKSKENECLTVTLPRSRASPPRRDFVGYKPQPGRIEDYEPGHSSISELEANKWWDEVLEIFDRWLERNPEAPQPACNKLLIDAIQSRREEEKSRPIRKPQSPSYAKYASAYISDPQYVYKRTEDELQSPPSSEEQKEAYRIIQKGGEIPLKGLRKPAPERPKDSVDTEIEYFPLSPTLTRIRVHKQNITPLSEFPFYLNPFSFDPTTLNYPRLPFGVCSSFSQVQLFPPPPQFALGGTNPETGQVLHRTSSDSAAGGDGKFSVQLQNISGREDYVQIVPKPRNQPKKEAPIYANVPPVAPVVTFSDLKRVAPSVNSSKDPKSGKKKEFLISKLSKKTPVEKVVKKEKKRVVDKTEGSKRLSGKKITKGKVPLSESIQREKPLSKTNKRLKNLSENIKKKKPEKKEDTKEDIIEYLSRFVEYQETSYVDLKTPEDIKESEATMSPIYESVEEAYKGKPKVESDMTEVFRSRSFSPDVKRKIFKLPDLNKPIPPKRKQSKISPTLKMWSKMMVSYPHHRSRLESFDSNVKFLGEKIKRKLTEEKEPKTEFGDDVETVRTVRKDKNGEMSIKTNRYVRLSRPSSLSTRATYPDIERRRMLSEPRTRISGSVDTLKTRKYSDASTVSKSADSDSKKQKETLVKSSTTYSVRNPIREEDEKRKSVKVTVAISSKGKELLRKTAGVSSPVKKTISKSSSPCPSVSSYKSGLSGKSPLSSTSSRIQSPQARVISPISSTSRLSSPSRSISPGSAITRTRITKTAESPKKPSAPPVMSTYGGEAKTKKTKEVSKTPTVTKQPGKRLLTQMGSTKEVVRRPKKVEKPEVKKNGKAKTIIHKKETNEVVEGRDLVRTDSFFQNLFLRGPPERKPLVEVERTSSVLERARKYQRKLNWPDVYKSEPSLSLVTYYLNQKRPVSFSRFRNMDQELSPSRSHSPLGSLHSEAFQMKLKRFDLMSQFGDDLPLDLSPEAKERSSSEPPLHRSRTNSPEQKIEVKSSRISLSEASSMRSSPTSSRSPSCRRIQNLKSSVSRKFTPRARSAGEVEELRSKSDLQYGDLGKSTSSLNLSNLSDHTEYQAYVLELMHSTRKCERFRELHKFYSNLERMGKLEKTASTGDLRPRLRNEEIIDFDRWKKIRTKERAEAELKTLVDNLVKVQKEKDLLFRAADVDAVRWKGDRGLRIKERSVEDLKEQFDRHPEEILDSDAWRKEAESKKDNYKPLWRGNSIVDVATNLNNTLVSHRGRPMTLEELEKIEKSNARIGKEYGYSLKAWSSLSSEQVNALKDQLSEIYAQEARRKCFDGNLEEVSESFEIVVPRSSEIKSPGESSLHVRCSSALSKSQTYTPTVRRKEEIRKEWKKAESISALPTWKPDEVNVPEIAWKEVRSLSEGRPTAKQDRPPRSKSASRPLSENEKKRLSMTLSREVIQKMTKASGKGPVFPRETLGALAAAGSKLRELPDGEIDTLPGRKEHESGSGSSETSIKTVIRKNSMDVLKKVQYFEDLQQGSDHEVKEPLEKEKEQETRIEITESRSGGKTKKNALITSSSMENISDYFGQQKQYATASYQSRSESKEGRGEEKEVCVFAGVERHRSASPTALRNMPSASSNESLFSYRSRSVSPDPTKYYRAYLRMVKCGAVRKLCNKFESWEDLLSLSSDRDFWLPPPRRFASDPELTRDMLRRFGTDPTKVTIRGQEVGDVRWLRTKFEKDLCPTRGRSRFRRVRSPLARSPLTVSDRFMPRINVISKTAELQMQGSESAKQKEVTVSKALVASPEGYRSLIDYTKDHGGYYYTGEVEKLRRKFERLQEAERLSILGQMYTSTPDVNELRDIAPYLECSWIAHRYPGVTKTSSTPDLQPKRQAPAPKKTTPKPRPHSSSPVRPKQPSSILKPSCAYPSDRTPFADQKFDPTIHRPKYRYQPEREVDRRYKKGDPDWWRHWNRPTVKFKESPRKYVESEVTIHYKSPVRSEAKAMLSEDELARRQAESMKRIYKEERRRKYLQELQDMNSRRHTDNFTPSQKSPISLNRYDDFPLDPNAFYPKGREYSTDPVLVARGLYDFVGRRPRELGFRRGDVIFIIRKLDKNWCEGELNGVVGLFPLSYVEVIPYNEINLKYGRARAKYDFIPQTSLELLAHKGDMIVLLRKIDENWFEGRIGERTGIIPASYCHVLAMPQASRIPMRAEKAGKPVAAPAAHSLIHNGSGLSSKHYYTPYLSPSSPGRSTASSTSATLQDGHPTADMLIDEALMQLDEEFDLKRSASKSTSQPLNVRINPRPEPALYQVLFNHVPNNDDELELIQGETVTVVEKCGDGWYIGSKTSDGKLGIFPGTHVRRIAPEFV